MCLLHFAIAEISLLRLRDQNPSLKAFFCCLLCRAGVLQMGLKLYRFSRTLRLFTPLASLANVIFLTS